MEETLALARQKALDALKLPEGTSDEDIKSASDILTNAKNAVAEYLTAKTGDGADRNAKTEALENDNDITEGLKKLDEWLSRVDTDRAKMAEADAERAKFAPNGINDIIGRDAETDWERAVQQKSDAVYMMAQANRCMAARGSDVTPLKETQAWRDYVRVLDSGAKAMYSTYSSYGDEWVPANWSPRLEELIRLELGASPLFDVIVMPTNPYYLPYLSGDLTAYVTAESTGAHGSGTAPTASDVTTAKRTLTAVKLGAKVTFTEELREDSIVPVMPVLEQRIAYALAEGREQATINGDSDGTHQDTDVDALGATDRRWAWNGLRKYALANAASKISFSAGFSTTTVRSMRAAMGKFGVDPRKLAWIVGPKGDANLRDLDEVTTVEKYGDGATIRTGTLPMLDGIPIIMSAGVRQDIANTGVNASSGNTYTFMLLVYKPAFLFGRRRGVTVRFVSGTEDVDQIVMVATMRECFTQLHEADTSNGHYPVTIGYAFSST